MTRWVKWLCLVFLLALITNSALAANFNIREDSESTKIYTSCLIVSIPKTNPTITVKSRSGQVLLKEKSPFSYKCQGVYYEITAAESYTVSGDDVIFSCTSSQSDGKVKLAFDFDSPTCFRVTIQPTNESYISSTRVSFQTPKDEHFYGLGEPRTGTLDLRGKQVKMWIQKKHPEEVNLIPFILSNKGYGIYVNSAADGTFDVAYSEPSIHRITWPLSSFRYYFVYGPEFKDIVRQYTELTGKPPMPPKWQFGLVKWLRPQGANQDVVLRDIELMEQNRIPLSFTWLEPQWETYMNSLIFSQHFPNPQELVDKLHAKGYRVGLWLRTDIFQLSPNYQAAYDLGYFVKDNTGSSWMNWAKCKDYFISDEIPGAEWYEWRCFVDFTNQSAADWWLSQLQQPLSYGFDGLKIDRGFEIDPICKFKNGEYGAAAHNRYGYHTAKAHYEFLEDQKGSDFFLMSKSQSAGAQSYVTLHWTGDQEGNFTPAGLPSGVIGIQSSGLVGFPFWTSDIGGWFDDTLPDKEVYLRWTQFSAFTPNMETLQNPWQFDDEAVDIFRFYAKLHYELIPYIYSLAYQSHQTGEPIVRPMVYDYQSDQAAAAASDQFMLGPSLLAAPVIKAGASSRNVYLPRGCWIDYWDNSKVHIGPKTVSSSAPIDSIPVFVKAGSIIPMDVKDGECGHGTEASEGYLTIDCYPRGRSSFMHYQDGKYQRICSNLSYPRLTIKLPEIQQGIILRINTQSGAPSKISINGQELEQFEDQSEFDQEECGWYRSADGRLWVKYSDSSAATVDVKW